MLDHEANRLFGRLVNPDEEGRVILDLLEVGRRELMVEAVGSKTLLRNDGDRVSVGVN